MNPSGRKTASPRRRSRCSTAQGIERGASAVRPTEALIALGYVRHRTEFM
jgi:hypothetical protein